MSSRSRAPDGTFEKEIDPNYLNPAYASWNGMRMRCLNPADKDFPRYGGSGISVHPAWVDFGQFLSDIGPKPGPSFTIERLNSRGDYAPGNVCWASPKTQARNRRNNKLVEYRGQRMPLVAAAELADIPYKPVKDRMLKGWSAERALTTPVRAKRKSA